MIKTLKIALIGLGTVAAMAQCWTPQNPARPYFRYGYNTYQNYYFSHHVEELPDSERRDLNPAPPSEPRIHEGLDRSTGELLISLRDLTGRREGEGDNLDVTLLAVKRGKRHEVQLVMLLTTLSREGIGSFGDGPVEIVAQPDRKFLPVARGGRYACEGAFVMTMDDLKFMARAGRFFRLSFPGGLRWRVTDEDLQYIRDFYLRVKQEA